eukprot:symbB.v1.2.007424.t1/scaffold453.1/size202423/15
MALRARKKEKKEDATNPTARTSTKSYDWPCRFAGICALLMATAILVAWFRLDDPKDLGLMLLTTGSCVIGAQYLQDDVKDQAAFTGFAVQEAILFVNRSMRHVLQLGLGAAVVPNFLRFHGVKVDVIEVSDVVLHMAETYFDFHSCCANSGRCAKSQEEMLACRERYGLTSLGEARAILFGDNRSRFDAVISDVFIGSNPGHLHSIEVFLEIQQRWLHPSGLLLVNFVGFPSGPSSRISQKLARTLRQVFAHVHCYRDEPEAVDNRAANLACFASSDPFRFNVPKRGDFHDPPQLSSFWIMKNFYQWQVLYPDSQKEIFQDSENELMDVKSQADIQAHFWSHAQKLIPLHDSWLQQ